MKTKSALCVLLCLCMLCGCMLSGCNAKSKDKTPNEIEKDTTASEQIQTECKHNMSKATCDKPSTCKECGYTEGSTIEHSYKEATCKDPKKCSTCGVKEGDALGHDYVEGQCTRCAEKDPDYKKIYSVGEKWIVDGEWEFTINSVKTHYLCSNYTNERDGYSNEQVVIIEYTFKNIGYNGINSGFSMEGENILSFWNDVHFTVYDQEGFKSDFYRGCSHTDSTDAYCSVGHSCKATVAFALDNNSDNITIEIEHALTNINNSNNKYVYATFEAGVE